MKFEGKINIERYNKKIHIIFVDENGDFIVSKDKHIRFVYLDG